jgi:hypothetical protein
VKDANHLHLVKIPSPTPFHTKSFQIQKENILPKWQSQKWKKVGLDSNKTLGNSSTNFASTPSLSSWSKAIYSLLLTTPNYANQLHERS